MNKTLRKTQLLPLQEEARWTPAQLSAFGELVPGYEQWYEANYDEAGACIGPCLLLPNSSSEKTQEEQA